jgi:tetratricopeptide (TPR) repeat protein
MRYLMNEHLFLLDCSACGQKELAVRPADLSRRLRCPGCSHAFEEGKELPPLPNLVEQLFRQAESRRIDRPDEALAILQDVLDLDPFFCDGHHSAGIIHDENGEAGPALHHLGKAVELRPGRACYRYDLGLAHLRQGDYPTAQAEFERALEILPSYLYAMNNLMACYFEQAEIIGAALVADRVAALDPGGPVGSHAQELLNNLAESDIPEGEDITAVLRAILSAFQMEKKGQTEEAANVYRRCLEILPEDLPSHRILAEYLANACLVLNRHAECLAFSEKARRGLPCVGALVPVPYMLLSEGGMLKDIQVFYERVAKRLFGITDSMAYFERDLQTLRSVAHVVAEGRKRLTIRRAGNLLRITDDQGQEMEHQIWEDEYADLEIF